MKRFGPLAIWAFLVATAPTLAAEAPYAAGTLDRLLASGEPVVVDFHADWCPTCRAQAPIIKALLATPERTANAGSTRELILMRLRYLPTKARPAWELRS